MGEVHPDVALSYGIDKRVYIAEFSLAALCAHTDETVRYEPLPKFPAVERDLALTVNDEVSAGSLLECIRKNAGGALRARRAV